MQEGTAVEVQWPSGARAMGYSFIGSYQSASGALPLWTHVQAALPACSAPLFTLSFERGGRGLINFETAWVFPQSNRREECLIHGQRGWPHRGWPQAELPTGGGFEDTEPSLACIHVSGNQKGNERVPST